MWMVEDVPHSSGAELSARRGRGAIAWSLGMSVGGGRPATSRDGRDASEWKREKRLISIDSVSLCTHLGTSPLITSPSPSTASHVARHHVLNIFVGRGGTRLTYVGHKALMPYVSAGRTLYGTDFGVLETFPWRA